VLSVRYKRAVPPAPLVGRSAELATVLRLLDDARAGDGSFLLVTGEAGIGKSRLLAELVAAAEDRGTVVLTGTAVEDGPAFRPVTQALLPVLREASPESRPELRPYRSALGRLLPDWAAEDSDERMDVDPALVLGEGVLRLLDRGSAHVLVLEDLQWADPDSMALLEYLAVAVRGTTVLCAASAQDDGTGPVGRLGSAPGTTVLALSPLPPEEAVALAGARLGSRASADAVRQVVERAEGVPLLLEELAEDEGGVVAAGGIPLTFATEVGRRLSSLSPELRSVVQAAASLGGDPDWTFLPRVAEVAEGEAWQALRAGVAAHLLVQDGSGLRWRHALTREAVAATLLPPERAALARRSAYALMDRGHADDEEHAARLLLLTGDVEDRTVGLSLVVRSAARERRRGALGQADRLLGLGEAVGGSVAISTERVRLLTLTGRPLAALESGESALPHATGDAHAELCLRLARAAIDARRWADAERYVERAGRPDDPRSPTLAADAAHGDGRVAEAAAHAARAVELAEDGDGAELLCEALSTSGRIRRLTDTRAAADLFARAAQVAAEHGLAAARVEALLGLGTLELLEAEESESLVTAGELALDHGLLSAALSVDLLLTDQLLLDRGPAAAVEPAARLVEQSRLLRLDGLQAMSGALLSLAYAGSGDLGSMNTALDEVSALPDLPPDLLAMADAARAHVALLAHDLATADALLDRGVPRLLEHESSAPLHAIGAWVLLRTVAGDGGAAAREAVRGLPAMRRPANRAALLYAEAVAAGRDAGPETAVAAFAGADATLRHSAWWRRLMRLLVLECALTDGWGDPVPELRANLSEHEQAGEERLAVTCRDLLRRAGAPTRRGRGSSNVPAHLRAAGVTSREMDVLLLVRDGLSNAEIAARLFLSVRTVETHVAHLLAKSGASDRTGLTSWSLDA
jgi:DNA-binding CsgD family transcriptional regulator